MKIEEARKLDTEDPLRNFRKQFHHSSEDLIYLDGNSLGRLPLGTKEILDEARDGQWGDNLIRSWNTDWLGINERIGAKIAKLIGAKANEVILTDSTSLNLFKLAYGSLKAQGSSRNRIVSDELNFPSDLYILQGLKEMFHNQHELILARSDDGMTVPESQIAKLLDKRTALLTLSYVCFKSSFMYDMEKMTQLAHDAGAHVIWDLSHAVGAVPVNLNESNADMAVGCTYKYLNGGPGSLAFLYVREDLQDKLTNPIWGWFADARPFEFDLHFKSASGIKRFQTTTTSILSAAAVEPGVDMLIDAGMENVRQKSLRVSAFLIDLFDSLLAPLGFSLGSPRNPDERGSHISIRHPEGYRISQSMIKSKEGRPVIIPDFREPDFIRLGITPLYTSFEDIYRAVERIVEIVETEEYLLHSDKRDVVT